MLPIDCVRLYDMMKATKSDRFHIYKNMIIGTESTATSLLQIICDTKIEGYTTDDNVVIDSYEIDKEVMKLISDKCATNKDNANFNPEAYISKYAIRGYKMTELQVLCANMARDLNDKFVPSLRIDDLKSNIEFMEILALKSGDGQSLFRASSKHILTLFTGLIPINKSDKASLEIYDIDNYSFIAKFIINKGKFIINKYIRYFYVV